MSIAILLTHVNQILLSLTLVYRNVIWCAALTCSFSLEVGQYRQFKIKNKCG